MKKLAVLMMIPALAMLMVPALASANWYYWWTIQGTWKMSASGSCLHSELPYESGRFGWLTAKDDSRVYAGVTVADGTWTFVSTGWLTGKGTYSQTIYATVLPGGAKDMPVETSPGVVELRPVRLEMRVFLPPEKPVEFNYEITPSGDITITEVNGVGVDKVKFIHRGSISADRKAMTLLTANQPVNYGINLSANTICNFSRTLIKVGYE